MPEATSRELTTKAATAGAAFSPHVHQGRVRVSRFTTPATFAWAQNDTWKIGPFPKGTRILPQSYILHTAFGTSVTMDVGLRAADDGTVIDVDKYIDGADVSAAGQEFFNTPVAADWQYETPEAVELYASFLSANPTDDAQAVAVILWTDGT